MIFFFVVQLLLSFPLFCPLCSLCLTSMVSFTGFYPEDNPKIAQCNTPSKIVSWNFLLPESLQEVEVYGAQLGPLSFLCQISLSRLELFWHDFNFLARLLFFGTTGFIWHESFFSARLFFWHDSFFFGTTVFFFLA